LIQKCKQLSKLYIGATSGAANGNITDMTLHSIATSHLVNTLTHLDLSSCTEITDQGLVALANLRKLKTLLIPKCTRVSPVALRTLASSQSVVQADANRVIGIDGSITLQSDSSIRWTLEELDLSHCYLMSDLLIVDHKHNHRLIASKSESSSSVQSQLNNGFVSLKTLRVSNCLRITDRALLLLYPMTSSADPDLISSSSIRTLDLSSCSVTDSGFFGVYDAWQNARKGWSSSSSSTPNTGQNTHRRDTMMPHLQLENLYLSNCRSISEAGLGPLLRTFSPHMQHHYSSLKSLFLNGCNKISDKVLQDVAKYARKFQSDSQ
jgi:hypothetical protein